MPGRDREYVEVDGCQESLEKAPRIFKIYQVDADALRQRAKLNLKFTRIHREYHLCPLVAAKMVLVVLVDHLLHTRLSLRCFISSHRNIMDTIIVIASRLLHVTQL